MRSVTPLEGLQEAADRDRPATRHLAETMAIARQILPKTTRAWLHLRLSVPQGFLSILGFVFLCLAVFVLVGVGFGLLSVGVCLLFVDWMRDRDDGPEEDE